MKILAYDSMPETSIRIQMNLALPLAPLLPFAEIRLPLQEEALATTQLEIQHRQAEVVVIKGVQLHRPRSTKWERASSKLSITIVTAACIGKTLFASAIPD